uniref:Uncharacterized protein n=1 Tax=viral metagenome TaxID=1070528 RepID=A0A6M3ISR5_9ZZZZ
MKKYKLEITEKQAKIITQSLNLFSRIGMGQLEEIINHPQWIFTVDNQYDRDIIKNSINTLKKHLCNLDSYSSFGIYQEEVDDINRVAWDLQQVIRHKLAWDRNPKGGITVDFGVPMKSSKEDLAKIEEI